MVDINAYTQEAKPTDYRNFASKMHFYNVAIATTLEKAIEHTPDLATVADFCCATGENTRDLSKSVPLTRAYMIDINTNFVMEALQSGIQAKRIDAICSDLLQADLPRGQVDTVLSNFAYHHIPDEGKAAYIGQANYCLKPGGKVILTETFLGDKQVTRKFYDKVFAEISQEERIPGLEEFINQTAESTDFEFKVFKNFADKQFYEAGFKIVDEVKIWPTDGSMEYDEGTFVQVYRKE